MGCSGGDAAQSQQLNHRTIASEHDAGHLFAEALRDRKSDSAPSFELPRFLPLTSLRVGRHAAGRQSLLFMWVDTSSDAAGGRTAPKRLVFAAAQSGNRPGVTRCRGPFAPPAGVAEAGIVALELHLEDIEGFDYWSSLLVDTTRVVLEAKIMEKHWFPSMQHCAEHFGWELTAGMPHHRREQSSGPGDDAAGRADPAGATSSVLARLYRPQAEGGDLSSFHLPSLEVQSTVREAGSHSPAASSSQPTRYWRQEGVKPPTKTGTGSDPLTPWRKGEVERKTGETVTEAHVTETIRRQTLHFFYDDLFVPAVLQEVIHDPDHPRLLRCYESGIPAWAVWTNRHLGLHCYTLRHVVFYLLLVISLVSMLLGFLDLYRKWPAARAIFTPLFAPMQGMLEYLGVSSFPLSLRSADALRAVLHCCWCGAQALARLFQPVLMLFGVWDVAQELSQTALAAVQACCTIARGMSWAASGGLHALWNAVTYIVPLCGSGATAISATVLPAATITASGASTLALVRAELVQVNRAIMSIYNFTIFLGVKCARHQASIILWLLGLRARIRSKLPSWLVPVVAWLPMVFAVLLVLGGLRQAAVYSTATTWQDLRYACTHLPGTITKAIALSTSVGTATPHLTEVRMKCGGGGISDGAASCWDAWEAASSHDCVCQYQDLQEMQITTEEPFIGPLRVAAQVRRGNESRTTWLSCHSDMDLALATRPMQQCHIQKQQLQRVLGGGAAAEVALLGYRREGHRLQVQELLSFQMNVPRKAALPLQSVRLCASPGAQVVDTSSSYWMSLLPECQRTSATEMAALLGQAARAGAAAARGATWAYASWEQSDLGSCAFQTWEVFLEVDGRLNLFCAESDAGARGCWGQLPEHHYAAYSLRVLAAVQCAEDADEPEQPAMSPWYVQQKSVLLPTYEAGHVSGSALLVDICAWVALQLCGYIMLRRGLRAYRS
mmetsp:Transcript_13900/g.25602  ORF Transcript_13900/g.25602 Transcript_13900/m.25602 type:complete len:952 (+) Transcript_13900:112-2967(+)